MKRSQAEQKEESVSQTDLPTRVDISEKTTDQLLDEIREQQIELIKRGLCPKCKAVTRPEKITPNKRQRDLPPRPPSPPRRPIQNRLVYPSKEPARIVRDERQSRRPDKAQRSQYRGDVSNNTQTKWRRRMVVPPMVEPGPWHQVQHLKFSKRSDQPTKTQIRRYQRMKKAAREWEQKYYEEKSRSIRILQAEAMKVTDVPSPKKQVIA